MAVLLEYGDKGLDLSNIPKKWNQVWPDVKLPTLEQKKNGRRKKGQLLHFIKEHAGDVVKVSRQKQNGQVSVIISPRDMSSYIKNFPWVASNSTKWRLIKEIWTITKITVVIFLCTNYHEYLGFIISDCKFHYQSCSKKNNCRRNSKGCNDGNDWDG